MTDEDIWDFLLKNEKMAWWFSNRAVGYKRSRYFISYVWEEAFKIIKSGGLDNGTVGTVFNYATLQALRHWRTKDATKAICVPYGLYGSYKSIKKQFNAGSDIIQYSSTGFLTRDEARVALIAMLGRKEIDTSVEDAVLSPEDTPDLALVHSNALDKDWDMHIDIGDLLKFAASYFTERAQTRGRDRTWKDWHKAKVSLYCLGRRYGIETKVMKLAPDIYGLGKPFDLVTPYIKDIKAGIKRANASWKGTNVKDQMISMAVDGEVSLEVIGEELGVTRERVRQFIVFIEGVLSEYTL